MTDDLPLSEAAVFLIAYKVMEGTAQRHEARQLLAEFVRQADRGQVTPLVIKHLRDCVHNYIQGSKTLAPSIEAARNSFVDVPIDSMDKALGLTRLTRGQPKVDAAIRHTVAMHVLVRLLRGETLDAATEAVATDRKANGLQLSSDTQVSDVWSSHKLEALVLLKLARTGESDSDGGVWAESEIGILRGIYANEPNVRIPRQTGR